MSVNSAYRYVDTREKIVSEMQASSLNALDSLKNNIAGLIAAYAVNEYDNIISNAASQNNYYAIVVEDFNMGKILGQEVFSNGKIRDENGALIEYEVENERHVLDLQTCCYASSADVVTLNGKLVGKITLYLSNDNLNKELNAIIIGTVFDALIISVLLIVSLLFSIRLFILKPVSRIAKLISEVDEDGLPVNRIEASGSTEISALSATMNKLIHSIRKSRVILKQQHEEIVSRGDELRKLSMATEQSPVSIILCDPEYIIEYANSQFERTSGYEISEITGHAIDYLFDNNPVNKAPLKELKQKLEAGKSWIGELTPLNKNNQIYCIRLSASAIHSDESGMLNYVFVAEDITTHKRNEEMLRNSQKMEAVGQLTGGVAHDFNNLLGIIMGNLELLEMTLQDQPKQLERIRQALASTQRGAQLTRKLLNFSRKEGVQKNLTQVNTVIENLVDLISKSVTASINVETRLEDGLWLANIDTGDFEDAILNLCLNARDAMPDGGTVLIETQNRHLDADYVKQHPDSVVGDYVAITVSDTGVGISAEAIKRVFDPFYSTKPFGKGTGLGLSMVYGFVQRSGGYIQIESEPGKGSKFQILLSRVETDENLQASEDMVTPPVGNEKILIVDDEEALSESAQAFLQQLGYSTLTATNARQALEILSENDDIELLFSDVVMPEINGFELSAKALKIKPGLKILLASGFSSEQIHHQGEHEKLYHNLSSHLLIKPYNIKELAVAVRQCLDRDDELLSA